MVDDKFGTMEQLERVMKLLKKKGIRTCIDFVLNFQGGGTGLFGMFHHG